MPADFTIKQGDTQPSYPDTLKYSNGTVPPLSDPTTVVVLRLRSLANASLTTLTGTVSIVNPNTGDILYTPTAADSANPGNYFGEWVVTSTTLGQQTFPTDGYNWIHIEPNLALLPQGVVSVAEIKRYLNIPGNDHTRDTDLLDLVDAITPLIEATVGPLVPKTYEEWYDGGSNVISLARDPSLGFGSNPYLRVIAASEYRGPIEYPLALVTSPVFGSIYSIMVVPDRASITRRTAGGRTLAFMPGRESVHIWYQSGQNPIPTPIKRAIMEYVRTLYRWPQQIGTGSLAPADHMEASGVLRSELSRIVHMYTRSMRRYPSLA